MKLCALVLALAVSAGSLSAAAARPRPDHMTADQKRKMARKYKPKKYKAGKKNHKRATKYKKVKHS
jgi:hypothetical protein